MFHFFNFTAGQAAYGNRSMARKHNITGIAGLSIGETKNDRGYSMTRYTVNHKVDGKAKAKSFYFGARQSQKDAFIKACAYMLESGLIEESLDPMSIYIEFGHSRLGCRD
jgi:hypothetical protein